MDLTEWERLTMARHATGNYLTYIGHLSRGGNWKPYDLEQANKWGALANKLNRTEFTPLTGADFPLCPYLQTAA